MFLVLRIDGLSWTVKSEQYFPNIKGYFPPWKKKLSWTMASRKRLEVSKRTWKYEAVFGLIFSKFLPIKNFLLYTLRCGLSLRERNEISLHLKNPFLLICLMLRYAVIRTGSIFSSVIPLSPPPLPIFTFEDQRWDAPPPQDWALDPPLRKVLLLEAMCSLFNVCLLYTSDAADE